jgi:chromosome segregation ATPase
MDYYERKTGKYRFYSLEEVYEELSLIRRRKSELEHRLQILSSASRPHNIIVDRDSELTHADEIDLQIEHIMSELHNLDSEQDILEAERRLKESNKELDEKAKQKAEARETIETIEERLFRGRNRSTHRGSDIDLEVLISEKEASTGCEKTITYRRGGRLKKLLIKIPQGIKELKKVR